MTTFTFGTTTVTIDPAYRALGGAMRNMAKNVFSFQVKKLDEGQWYLITNRQNFIGRYPSQAACISVLYGIMTFNDGLDAGFSAWLNESLDSGSSEIDPDINILVIEVAGADPNQTLGATVSQIDYSVAPTAGEYWFAYQNSTDSGATWGVNGVASSFILGDRVTAAHGGSQTDTPSTTTYDAFAENSLMRGVLVERILTQLDGTGTTSIHAPGAIWQAAISGLSAVTWEISSAAGSVGASLQLTFADYAAIQTFLANAEYISITANGNTTQILVSDFPDPGSGVTLTATSANAISAVADVDAAGGSAVWEFDVVSYGTQNIVGYSQNTIWKDDVDETDLSGLTMVISGDSTAGDPVVRGGYAYSVVDESGAVLDPGESISYTYAWYREIPTLTGITGGDLSTADVFELAVPNNQLVTNTTFTVDVLAANYDSSVVGAPQVNGQSMSLRQLQYPGTATNSVQVWSLDLTLTPNTVNSFTITSGAKTLALVVEHKSSLTTINAANAAAAISALENASTDVVNLTYAETDLAANVLTAVSSWPSRSSYVTVQGASVLLPNDTTDGTTGRDLSLPANTYLKISGASIGRNTDDGGGGNISLDSSSSGIWFDGCVFTQKYTEATYTNAYDAAYSPSIEKSTTHHTAFPKTKTAGRDCIFTSCQWNDWAYKSVSVRDILIRDCTLTNIRGDFNNNGRVILNNRVINPSPIWETGGADKTHVDMFQVSSQTANQADGSFVVGLEVHTDAFAAGYQGQAILLSGSNAAETSVDGLLLDTITFTGNRADMSMSSQLAQGVSSARLSNIDLYGQRLYIRRDLASPFEAGPEVYLTDITSSGFAYTDTLSSTTLFNTDATDVSSSFASAVNADKQPTETNVTVSGALVDNPAPTGATYFGGPTTDEALIYQSVLSPGTNQGQLDTSVLPAAFVNVIRFNVRNVGGTAPQMRAYFNTQAERDTFLGAVTDVTMTIAGYTYNFAAAGWSNVTSTVIVCVPTGGDPWPTATASGGLWGDGDDPGADAIPFSMSE